MRTLLIIALSAASVLGARAHSSLEELMEDMNTRQVEALQAYVAANPEAADSAEARERLIYALIAIDDYDGALEILRGMYEALPAEKAGLELSDAFGEIIVPMIQLYQMSGQREEAQALIARVREDFQSHDMIETINEGLDEFSRMFELPGKGDILDLAFTALDGREINLAAMTGTVVLVDFWATWCMPCIRAMPGLMKLHADYHEKGFEIIGISLDEERERLERYLERENIPWPQHFDGLGWENEFAVRYGIQAIPATFLIGPDGVIIGTDLPEAALREHVAALLDAPEESPIKQED
ncbi:MAG TPA: thioredoxin-like domain-containing protein [Kiritimatiellia bacterium]|nr:thioredoxin-like domain-containing protein [Kiritimatiellia bacterium]HMP00346.1 thioredoxin-like domain-containing protein [Kiritimatiellia bacterium]HMP97205.1 thioredoxin-like domain-containing protein [Kiritimatiellia bacterium]